MGIHSSRCQRTIPPTFTRLHTGLSFPFCAIHVQYNFTVAKSSTWTTCPKELGRQRKELLDGALPRDRLTHMLTAMCCWLFIDSFWLASQIVAYWLG